MERERSSLLRKRMNPMSRSRLFCLLYGVVLSFYLCISHVQGEGRTNSKKVSKVPPNHRDNPRVYRTHYFYGK